MRGSAMATRGGRGGGGGGGGNLVVARNETRDGSASAAPASHEDDAKNDERKTRKREGRQPTATSASNRKMDTPLVFTASVILCLVLFVELKTSPRKIMRRAMESIEYVFHYAERGDVHAQMLNWRGWHSLEVGVEIACALTLGFLNWLLFASVFDVAGIIVGLIPAMATFLGVLVFRFHARSYFVLGLIPLVVMPAIGCAKLLERRIRIKEERRMMARKERRREQRIARETRHQNGFVVNNSEDPTRASGRTTIDATLRRTMSVGELSPTTRVVTSGLNAANGSIKGFNVLSSNSGGAREAVPTMPAKMNALAGQPRHARGSSAPELGFNKLSSSQQAGGAQNTAAAATRPPPPPYFGANIPDIGGVEQNAPPVPKLQNPIPFANNNGVGTGGVGTNRLTTNLLNANPSRTAKRFNVRKPNLETIHSPVGTFGTATTNANSNGGTGEAGRVSHQWENDDQLMTKVEESTNTSDTHTDAVVQDVVV